MLDEVWNAIYIDGLRLEDVQSGDVSFVAERVRDAIAKGGDWINIATSVSQYELYVAATSSVVVRYRHA